MRLFQNTNYDFLRWRWHALALSAIVIIAGAVMIATRGLQWGIEFAGGTAIIAQFENEPSIEDLRSALSARFGEIVVQTYGEPAQHQVMIRIPQAGEESGDELGTTAEGVNEALAAANVGKFEVIGTEIVSATVGRELTSKGTWATILSLGGILLYLTFRYQLSFALGAVVATLHDLLVVLTFLAFFRYDITLNVIAAILTVAGYSGNDTIVVFDRVRENMRGSRRDGLAQIINTAVNQTLSRTVITAGTTFLAVFALYLFGGDVLEGFAFTLLVGIVVGTYSTVFIAGSIVIAWQGTGRLQKAAAVAPAAGAQQPTRKSKPQRKARAS